MKAGWREGRRIETEGFRRRFEEIGLEYPANVDGFLREFGMLDIDPEDKRYFDVSFDVFEAIGCNLDGSYFRDCLEEYGIDKTAYPIGLACRKELFVLMTAEGGFYCFTNGLLLFLGHHPVKCWTVSLGSAGNRRRSYKRHDRRQGLGAA